MAENKRYSFNWERGHPNFWDNHCDLADCYLTCEDVVKLLNELHEENKKLRTLNYVNKEAVRLNCIKTVKIGNNDVDCSNIDWEHLYELYGAMIDYYYGGDVE